MANGFTFAGRGTAEFRMYVEKIPNLTGAVKRITPIQIPGRNGSLHSDEGVFDNVLQSYECYFHGEKPTPAQAHDIKAWLQGSSGQKRLEDVYDPDVFRMATYTGPFDVENILNQYGRVTVTFDCQPQCFLKSGEVPVNLSKPDTLNNPTEFAALPLIVVYGNAPGTVDIGNYQVKILGIEDEITVDCEAQNAFRQVGTGAPENKNSQIYAPLFPALIPGENVVRFSGGITGVKIIPRWWTI